MAESKIKVTQPLDIDRTFFTGMRVTNASSNARYLTLVFDIASSATGLLSGYTQIQLNFTNQDLQINAYNGSSWSTLARWTKTS